MEQRRAALRGLQPLRSLDWLAEARAAKSKELLGPSCRVKTPRKPVAEKYAEMEAMHDVSVSGARKGTVSLRAAE